MSNATVVAAIQALAELTLANPTIEWPTPEQILARVSPAKQTALLGIGYVADPNTGVKVPVRALVATETDLLLLKVSAYIETSLGSIHELQVQLSMHFIEGEYAALLEQDVIDEDDAEYIWPI